MKFKSSRSTEPVTQPARKKRLGLFATPRALDSDRPTRVYSLLLPPSGHGPRR